MVTAVERWQVTASYAFLLRWPGAFKERVSTWSKETKAKLDLFQRLGLELEVLELDLLLTVDELRTAYEVLYAAPEHLARKKFAVVYHTDNFYVRTRKLTENVYGLLALSVGLDLDAKPVAGAPSRRQTLSTALTRRGLTNLDTTLRAFEGDRLIREAADARNLFVHRYREETKWPVLGPASRLLEFEDTDETERLIRRQLEPPEIDRYAARKAAEFDGIIELVGGLRIKLFEQYLEEILIVLAKESSVVRARWQWLIDWAALLRDIHRGAI